MRPKRTDVGEAGAERLLQVKHDRAGSDERGLRVFEAEASERAHLELRLECVERARGVEGPVRSGGVGARHLVADGLDHGDRGALGIDRFCTRQPIEFIAQLRDEDVHRAEGADREIDPREPIVQAFSGHHGDEVVRRARVQQCIFGHGARRHDAVHFAVDDPLRLVRLLHLFAHGDAIPGAE